MRSQRLRRSKQDTANARIRNEQWDRRPHLTTCAPQQVDTAAKAPWLRWCRVEYVYPVLIAVVLSWTGWAVWFGVHDGHQRHELDHTRDVAALHAHSSDVAVTPEYH